MRLLTKFINSRITRQFYILVFILIAVLGLLNMSAYILNRNEINFILGTIQDNSEKSIADNKDLIEKRISSFLMQRACDIAQQLDIYLKYDPQSLEELKTDPDFRKLAIQKTSATGYTSITDIDGMRIAMHISPNAEGLDLYAVGKDIDNFDEVVAKVKNGENAGTSYYWKTAEGDVVYKYMAIAPLKEKTKDGKRLSVTVSENMDKFSMPVKIIGQNMESSLIFSRDSLQQVIDTLNYLMLIFLAFFVLFLFISYRIIQDNISLPINKLMQGIKIMEKGDLSHRIKINSHNEIGNLAYAFNKMATALKKTRDEIDRQVTEQTEEIEKNNKELSQTKEAILNILEDVEKERDLSEQEREKVETILGSIGDAVFTLNREGNLTSFNKACEKLIDMPLHKLLGTHFTKIFNFFNEDTNEPVGDNIEDIIKNKKICLDCQNLILETKPGEKISIAASVATLQRDKNIFGVVIVMRDVTKEREISRMKTEFVSIASHQLRTPLSSIKWLLEMVINGDAGKINEKQLDYLDSAYKSNQRMIRLVNDLLNISRIESGRIAIEPKPTDMLEMANNVIREITPRALNKKQTLVLKKPSKKIPVINIDPKLIYQVLANLVSNAINYSPPGTKIEVGIKKQKNDIVAYVKDNGIGIPKRQQEHIFNKFFRADNAIPMETEGTGLGLYVAKSVIESSGGKIWFKSKENKGSTFFFALPISGSHAKKGEKTLIKQNF